MLGREIVYVSHTRGEDGGTEDGFGRLSSGMGRCQRDRCQDLRYSIAFTHRDSTVPDEHGRPRGAHCCPRPGACTCFPAA